MGPKRLDGNTPFGPSLKTRGEDIYSKLEWGESSISKLWRNCKNSWEKDIIPKEALSWTYNLKFWQSTSKCVLQ